MVIQVDCVTPFQVTSLVTATVVVLNKLPVVFLFFLLYYLINKICDGERKLSDPSEQTER